MVAVILQLAEIPTPDDTADALATAICIANAERAADRPQRRDRAPARRRSWTDRRSTRSRAATPRTSAPSARRSPASRRAARSRPGRRRAARRRGAAPARDRIRRGRGRCHRRQTRSSSRSAGSATGSSPPRRSSPSAVPGGRLKLHTYHLVREDQQALFGFRNAEELGFFNLLLTVTGVGPKVAMAIVGSRAHRGPPARDPPAGPGGAGVDPRASARSSPSGSSSSSRRRCPPRAIAAGTSAAVSTASEGEVVAALQALGYSLGEAREASRLAVSDPAVGAGLEERVKAALRTLLRD